MLKPILILSLFASPALAQRLVPFEKRFEKMKTACLTSARATIEPSIRPVSELGYSQTLIDSTLMPAGKVIAQGIGELQDLKVPKAKRLAARAELEQVLSAMKGFEAEHPSLTSYQKACIATCASAHLIEYSDLAALDSETPSSIIAKGQGLCRHFARLGAKFMQKLGLFAWVVGGDDERGGDHAWTSVRISGHQYWVEPQLDNCTLYRK